MSGIFMRGWGAVSPAGWGVPTLVEALRGSEPVVPVAWPGPRAEAAGRVRTVPPPAARPAFHGHPRLRRASAITQFAMASVLEAFERARLPFDGRLRLGIVVGTHTAPLRYSERFYGEVLHDPATAGPILFPETVINAPASHLAAYLGGMPLAYTVIGDQTAFAQALLVAAGWLLDGRVELGLVVGAEELAWPAVQALRLFSPALIAGEGAGAVLLSREPGDGPGVSLERVTDACGYASQATRLHAARTMRSEFPPPLPGELLVDSRCGTPRVDRAESAAWEDWTGVRWSPRVGLGEALAAATAWQFIAACEALATGLVPAANVSVVGSNQQAIGARLARRAASSQ